MNLRRLARQEFGVSKEVFWYGSRVAGRDSWAKLTCTNCAFCEFIEEHIGEKISLDVLSSVAELSPNHFARAFQQSVGLPLHWYLLRRLEHVEQMLRETQLPLSQIALAVGFSDQSHLARHFRRLTGVPPTLARRWS